MRFQSLVTFFVLVGSVVSADDTDEAKAIEKIELLGGKVWKDDKLPGSPVVSVDLKESHRLSDRYLHFIGWLPCTIRLNLASTQITDEGIARIKHLENVEILDVSNTQLSDAGLNELLQLKKLRWLNVADTRVTDGGLKDLSEFKNLNGLSLQSCQITDDGLKALYKLKHLTRLNLRQTNATDTGLKELQEALPNLRIYQGEVPGKGLFAEIGEAAFRILNRPK